MTHTAVPLTIEEFGRRLRRGDATSTGLVDACLRQIGIENPRLNVFIRVMADDARRKAAEADVAVAAGRDRGPLHGVPIAVKDLIDIAGVPTTAASRVREKHVARADAPIITRLTEAGAIPLGKANLDEFAFGTTNENSAYGPALNPHDPSRSPGGSSGGSAVAVAAGMAPAALGTDTGGSVRIPAAACGVVGLKPTYGEVPIDGVVPLCQTLDHVGSFARSVTDVWLVHRALVGSTSSPVLNARSLDRLRLGVPRTYFCEVLDADVRARFDAALIRLQEGGVRLHDVDVPHASMTPAVYIHIHSSEAATYHARTLDTHPELYTKTVRLRLELGRSVLAEDYVRAMRGRDLLRAEVDAALADCDALILPTLPIPAPPLGVETMIVEGAALPVRTLMLRNTQLFNITGHPAISLPNGTTSNGLPCGLQLVGRPFETEKLLELAFASEERLRSS